MRGGRPGLAFAGTEIRNDCNVHAVKSNARTGAGSARCSANVMDVLLYVEPSPVPLIQVLYQRGSLLLAWELAGRNVSP